MSAVLFLGPSLDADQARADYGRDDLHLLPPAEQGDVLRSLSLAPRVIGLVDGRFDGVPAVLHKEILYALQCGVHVLGAASMGALRAAELHGFGMLGIGGVFEAYRDGLLHDDDAVALLHAGPEHGYQPVSEALVDIQATLVAAQDAGVLGESDTRRLTQAAAALEYGHRQWDTLLAVLGEQVDPERMRRFRQWLETGRVFRKRDDARLLVTRMRSLMDDEPPPFEASFTLQASHHWEDFRARHQHGRPGMDDSAVLDELRLDEAAWQRLRDAALLRVLARREAARQGIDAQQLAISVPLAALRQRHTLTRRADLDAWLLDAGLDGSRLQAALGERAATARLCELLAGQLDDAMLTEAGLQGDLVALRRRATAKRALLDDATGSDVPAPPLLLEWFFIDRRGVPIPTDLHAHATLLGLRDTTELLQVLRQEYLYQTAANAVENGSGPG